MNKKLHLSTHQSRILFRLMILMSLNIVVYNSYSQQKSNRPLKKTTMAADTTTKKKPLSPQERAFAVGLLTETEAGVSSAIEGLNQIQLTYKPAADKWSIEECVKHIAISEKNLWEMVNGVLKQPANPEKRTEIKSTDEAFINAVKDRSHKSKTVESFEPIKSGYKSLAEAITSFKENRAKLVAFVQSTPEDLRDHVAVLPMGTYDAYQLILLIGAHSDRHTQQIEEVKANVNFPKR